MITSLAIAASSIAIAATSIPSGRLGHTPYHYHSDIFLPLKGEYCPGERLEALIGFTFDDTGPAVIRLVETWAIPGGETVVFDDQPTYVIQYGFQSMTIPLQPRYVPDLPPGQYEFRRAGSVPPSSASPAFFRVPFVVPEGCP